MPRLKSGLVEDTTTWVSFKYEKLTNFCYWCGMVSHEYATHSNPVRDKTGKIINNLGDEAKSNSTHVINQITETPHDTIALRSWKRLSRNNPSLETPIHLPVAHKRARELEKGAHPE